MTEIKHEQPEMPPTRWGDPAAPPPLPTARGDWSAWSSSSSDTPAAADVAVPAVRTSTAELRRRRCARSLGAEHVRADDAIRRLRTRGKSTPDLLRAARRRPRATPPTSSSGPAGHDDVQRCSRYAQ